MIASGCFLLVEINDVRGFGTATSPPHLHLGMQEEMENETHRSNDSCCCRIDDYRAERAGNQGAPGEPAGPDSPGS
jgi:hypothetical protein